MNKIKNIVTESKYVVTSSLLKIIKSYNLNPLEMMFIIFYDNQKNKEFNIPLIMTELEFSNDEVLNTLASLMEKSLISLDIAKDNYNKNIEVINLDVIYNAIEEAYNANLKVLEKDNIFESFSKEFNRKLTSMEYEIINAWLNNGYSEELILSALKEAVFNGVNNFRYIDKILYEWHKLGFTKPSDIKEHLINRTKDEKDNKELFDYNWLEEENKD